LNLLSYSNIDISPCLNAKNSYSFILWWTHIPTYTNSQIQLKNIPTSITIWLSLTALFVTMTMLYWSIVEWHNLPSVHLAPLYELRFSLSFWSICHQLLHPDLLVKAYSPSLSCSIQSVLRQPYCLLM
jgi:hypothetical protein